MEKNKGKIIGEIKNSKGITLLALAVTIVVLLILTSIGVKLALGNNGIIGEAKNAKEQAEIDDEKGIVKRATTVSLIKSKGSKVEQDTLEKALNDETGEGKTEVSDAGDVFEILFTDSDRYYEVDSEGNISDVNKITKDEYAGDITKGGRCDGSEEKPYEISCIEDLVILANRTNGKGNYIDENGEVKDTVSNSFIGKKIILTRTLNFESKYSYSKTELKWSYDSENESYKIDDSSTTTLQEIITDKTGVGFVPIGTENGTNGTTFRGSIDGMKYTIKNLYEKKEGRAGLFRYVVGGEIKNLKVTGEIIATNAGGITYIASNDSKFYNCSSMINISANNSAGIASQVYGTTMMINCYNGGNGITGGLMNWDEKAMSKIVNCYNSGNVNGKTKITAYNYASGIIGASTNNDETKKSTLINVCSLGKMTETAYNFYYTWTNTINDLTNCFYPSSMTKNNSNVELNEGSISFDDSNVQEVVNTLNAYVKEHKNDYEVPLKEWKIGTVNGEKAPVLIDD